MIEFKAEENNMDMKEQLIKELTQIHLKLEDLAKELNELSGANLYTKQNLLRDSAVDAVDRAYESKEKKDLIARINQMTEENYFNYVKEVLLKDFSFGWMKLINSTTAVIEDHYPGAMGRSYSDIILEGPIDEVIREYIARNPARSTS